MSSVIRSLRFPLLVLALVLIAFQLFAANGQLRIVQTNSGGDNIHIIDPATNKVVAEIKGVPINHGAAVSTDGSRLYFSSEAEIMLEVVDTKTLAVTKKIPLTGRPNNITISKDGRKVYVAIVAQPGNVDVIDTVSLTKVKSIPTQGGLHNIYMTPDGKYVVAGSIAGKKVTVIDANTEEVAWTISFEDGVRPVALDGSANTPTKRMFVQVSNFHGIVIVDFDQHKEISRINMPEVPLDERNKGQLNAAPAHGLGVSPDGKTLWSCSRLNGRVYAYSLPDMKVIGDIKVGKDPDWLTFTPDSKFVYVANAGSDFVSAIDMTSKKEVARIPVGKEPKRNITALLP
jgi:YVTN family beta-propeller protein